MAGGARKQIIEKQGARHQALTLAFLLLTLQPHHDSKAAFEIIGVRVMSIWQITITLIEFQKGVQ